MCGDKSVDYIIFKSDSTFRHARLWHLLKSEVIVEDMKHEYHIEH